MRCPVCDRDGFYVGLHERDCGNIACSLYSEKHKEDEKKPEETKEIAMPDFQYCTSSSTTATSGTTTTTTNTSSINITTTQCYGCGGGGCALCNGTGYITTNTSSISGNNNSGTSTNSNPYQFPGMP